MANLVLADPHFGHRNIIEYCDRPFVHVEEMNYALINNINSVSTPDDILYCLGDFAYGKGSQEKIASIVEQIIPKIILFKGNHDHETRTWYLKRGFLDVIGGEFYTYKDGVILSHRPYPVKAPIINIYGHIHNLFGISNWNYRCVSVEQINYTPVDLDELVKEIRSEAPSTSNC